MDYDLSQLSDFDNFFFYGEQNETLDIETQSDIISGLTQPKRSLFYNRQDGAGVVDKENFPNGVVMAILTKFDVAQWSAYRNTQVSDGANGLPDRRVSMSQSSINILKNDNGEFNLSIGYIPFANIKKTSIINLPITRGV